MKIMVRCKGYKSSERYFTVGKVYEWEDGNLTNDNGFTYDNFMCDGADPKEWSLSAWYDFEVVKDQKIVITTDGKETLARLYEDNNVIKTATARCAPDDTFDFATGAKLAFDRLMGVAETADKPMTCREKLAKEKPECVGPYGGGCKGCPHDYGYAKKQCNHKCRECWDRPVEQPEKPAEKEEPRFKVGDRVKIVKGLKFVGEIGTIVEDDGSGAAPFKVKLDNGESHWKFGSNLEKVEFTPHLVDGKRHLGNIGEPTNYKDAFGRPLCVGDIVEHFNPDCESYGDTVIVKAKLSYRNNEEKAFVMCIENACDDKKGTTGEWKILKKRSFEEVANGEKVGFVKYVKEI